MDGKFQYPVPRSRKVNIHTISLGAGMPVIIQSMANTPTTDVPASVRQFRQVAEAGGEMIRFTTPTMKDAGSLREIAQLVREDFPGIPVVADVHFQSNIALEVASFVDKVRINPGNFAGKQSSGNQAEITRKKLTELLDICENHKTAMRIGVNHGSLSPAIMEKYGDTPEGMVASAMEYLQVCREKGFEQVVVSLKSSNTVLMVKSVRLLVSRMLETDMYYPLHLGVTEAGDGLEGRLRSVAGIAPLLMEGMGDTIRISLTEPPENEIPVAGRIATLFPKPEYLPYNPFDRLPIDPFSFNPPHTRGVLGAGGDHPVMVVGMEKSDEGLEPDILTSYDDGKTLLRLNGRMLPLKSYNSHSRENPAVMAINPVLDPDEIGGIETEALWIMDPGKSSFVEVKEWLLRYYAAGGKNPVILKKHYHVSDRESFVLQAGGEFSLLLIDHLLAGVWLENNQMEGKFLTWFSFQLLQATRNRFTSTEYIACPSCGRTLFDIQQVLSKVKDATSHLKGLTIAVMGCIVNGPGEMADADYGYIGAGRNKVSIFKGKHEVVKNVPQETAVDTLVSIIKENGDWQEP